MAVNPNDYLNLIELENMQNAGTPPATAAPAPPGVSQQKALQQIAAAGGGPSFNQYDSVDPIRRGALEAADSALAVREKMVNHYNKQRTASAGNFLNDLVQNLSVAYMRTQHPHAAQGMHTPYENVISEADKVTELLKDMERTRLAQLQHDEIVRQHDEQIRHNRAQEEYMKPYYAAQTHKFKKEELEELKNLKLQEKYPQAKTFSSMPKGSVNDAMKELRTRANKPTAERAVLKTLNDMKTIVDKHPDLSTSFAAMIMPSENENLRTSALRKSFVNKKDRIALEELEKLSASLVGKETRNLGATRGNQFLEKMMKASNPHAGLTPEAVTRIRDDFKREHEYSLRDAELARAGIAQGFYAPMLMEEEEPAANTTSVIINGVKRPLTGNITPERLQELQAKGYEVVND